LLNSSPTPPQILNDEYDLDFYREILSFYNTRAYENGVAASNLSDLSNKSSGVSSGGSSSSGKVSNSTPTLPAAVFKSDFYFNLFN
jgi:N-acetylmuramoyl-L-alanine amidase CwlA